jgi:ABC-type spermidine/putrescine transport system permease subunit II
LPLLLFSQLRMGATPEAHALAVVMLGLAGTGLCLWQVFLRRTSRES